MTTARGFRDPTLTRDEAAVLRERARRVRGAILTATSVAGSGHPGGSFSSLETFMVLYNYASLRPAEPLWPGRDRVVVSHGHVSPGVYAALADAGYFDVREFEAHFRQAGSPFEGHVERSVPGVEWDTGNLGQGLSAGVGFALAARLRGERHRVFVAMSDGEQNKGQVAEARRLARAQGLDTLTAVVDLNRVQISGHTGDVMPVDVSALWSADGWRVLEVDGHDVMGLYAAFAEAVAYEDAPTVVLAHTLIGKGVSFMEDEPAFHGRALTPDEYVRAMAELGLEQGLEAAAALRSEPVRLGSSGARPGMPTLPSAGSPREYSPASSVDCRSAWGRTLDDLADANPDSPLAVFDCDLAESVKTASFAASHPASFIECGVGEHNAAAAAGACAGAGVSTFLADFGVFGIDEVYNQQRLNDINDAGLKLVVTHCGLDVGEDGKTHQCLDYVGALRDFFGWRVLVPADAAQTDRIVRYMATTPGNMCVAMGRSKLPPILAADGSALFGGDYAFEYGAVDRVLEGGRTCVLVMGTPSGAAVAAVRTLAARGESISLGVVSSPLELSEEDAAWVGGHDLVVTIEDHAASSGLGATVAGALMGIGSGARLLRHGVTAYQGSGRATDLYRAARLDEQGILSVLEARAL
jgi:transketolase